MDASSFHAGERALQQREGVAVRLAELGPQLIRPAMPLQHQRFFAGLPFLVVAGLDGDAQPWASVLAGAPGFVVVPDAGTLLVRADFAPGDPLAQVWTAGAPFGALGIDPATRRRNRANGRVLVASDDGYQLTVQQSFGNCPRYIRVRVPQWRGPAPLPRFERSIALNDADCRLISQADTCFIASAHPQARHSPDAAQGVDVSHRGGPAGFIRIRPDGVLTLPDFSGNQYFNTLGNLLLNPRAGLLFIDFVTGDLLWVAVQATLVEEVPDSDAVAGALRLLSLQPTAVIRAARALPLQWGDDDETSSDDAAG